VVFYIVSGTLCFIQICFLLYLRNAITRVRKTELDLAKFDWKTLMTLESDFGALKQMYQKLNGRISGMGNSKYDLTAEIQKGMQAGPTTEFLDG
jgi:hypothetical protein